MTQRACVRKKGKNREEIEDSGVEGRRNVWEEGKEYEIEHSSWLMIIDMLRNITLNLLRNNIAFYVLLGTIEK